MTGLDRALFAAYGAVLIIAGQRLTTREWQAPWPILGACLVVIGTAFTALAVPTLARAVQVRRRRPEGAETGRDGDTAADGI